MGQGVRPQLQGRRGCIMTIEQLRHLFMRPVPCDRCKGTGVDRNREDDRCPYCVKGVARKYEGPAELHVHVVHVSTGEVLRSRGEGRETLG